MACPSGLSLVNVGTGMHLTTQQPIGGSKECILVNGSLKKSKRVSKILNENEKFKLVPEGDNGNVKIQLYGQDTFLNLNSEDEFIGCSQRLR